MTKLSGIYAIEHVESGRLYIGSSINIARRFVKHRNELKSQRHHCLHLQRAWNLYGSEAFTFGMLEEVPDVARLVEREQYWLDQGVGDFNTCRYAATVLGVKRTEETRRRMSKAQKGRKFSDETKAKMSRAGKMRPPEYYAAIGQKQRGRKHTEEHKRKISEAGKGRKHSAETKAKIAAGNRNRVWSKEAREKVGAAHRGRTHSAATRNRMRESQKTRPPVSEETRARLSASLRGMKRSAECRIKLSEAARNRSPEHIKKSAETRKRKSRFQKRSILISMLRERLRQITD